MIRHEGRKLRLGECWFREESIPENLDLISYRQINDKIKKGYSMPFHTLLTDLTLDEETLSKKIRKSTFSKIKRARDRDGIKTESFDKPDDEILRAFVVFFNRFAYSKDLGELENSFLQAFQNDGCLVLRKAVSVETGEDLVWHSYIVNAGRARLFHSASDFRNSEDSGYRNMIGRVNRFLHWDDMLFFKKQGLVQYDMGGWYAGDNDNAKLAINSFKEEFGGEIIKEWDSLKALTMKGRLYILRKKIRAGKG